MDKYEREELVHLAANVRNEHWGNDIRLPTESYWHKIESMAADDKMFDKALQILQDDVMRRWECLGCPR